MALSFDTLGDAMGRWIKIGNRSKRAALGKHLMRHVEPIHSSWPALRGMVEIPTEMQKPSRKTKTTRATLQKLPGWRKLHTSQFPNKSPPNNAMLCTRSPHATIVATQIALQFPNENPQTRDNYACETRRHAIATRAPLVATQAFQFQQKPPKGP